MNALLAPSTVEGGFSQFRRFGPFGPAYEVLSVGPSVARIRIVESGEELDYPVEQMKGDIDA